MCNELCYYLRMNKVQLAYAAGIMDGEGNIGIVKRQWSKRNDKYHLQVRVTMCDREIPEWFQSHFGGGLSIRKRTNLNHRPVYTWQISHRSCIPMLKAILPYLICKKPQVELGIAFQQTKRFGGGLRGKIGRPAKTEAEFALEEFRYILMRQLKHRIH